MHDAARAALLGLVQGAAEPLPISSSAHVMLVRGWLGRAGGGSPRGAGEDDPSADKLLDVGLHAGSLAALAIAYFAGTRKRCRSPRGDTGVGAARWWPAALDPMATLAAIGPAVLVGALLERPIEARLRGRRALAAGLLAGSVALALADRAPRTRRAANADWRDGLALGLGQAVALAPGVSRLGATLAAARARGFADADARLLARQAGLPVIAGAVALKAVRALRERAALGPALAGASAAFVATAAVERGASRSGRTPATADPRPADDGIAPAPSASAPTIPLRPYAAYRGALALALLWQDGRRDHEDMATEPDPAT